VRTSQWGVWITPARAEPSRAAISKTGGTAKSLRSAPKAEPVRKRPHTGRNRTRRAEMAGGRPTDGPHVLPFVPAW
jgi:hypothetical protein